jgi:putative ABC transport system permease protein
LNGLGQLLILVLISLAVVGILAARRKTLARMSMRNIVRKKRYTILVVSGLLVSTAMISGSLVVADTLDYIIKQGTFDSTGNVDEVVSILDDAGRYTYFNQSVAYDLISLVNAGSMNYVDGAAPAIREGVTVINPVTGASAPTGMLFGFDRDHHLDTLVKADGSEISGTDTSGGMAVINKEMADKIEAAVGDTVLVIPQSGIPIHIQVSVVAMDTGMALWRGTETLFVDLSFAQTLYSQPGLINSLDVSNKGGIESGYKVADQAVQELKQKLPSDYDFNFLAIKADGIDAAQQTSDQISQIFIIMSSFAIIAGVALIINIFVMLAEERKPEMGISRAIGMQRGDLTQSFMFEGVVYALLASAVGAFAGLAVASLMIVLFSSVFTGSGMSWTLHFTWASLMVAACAGFLITLVTVVVASWRVSKLNIVRAIRDIPEPMLTKSDKRYIIPGVALTILGLLVTLQGAASLQVAQTTLGPCLMALGGAMVSLRFVGPRVPFSIVGAFMIFWQTDPFDINGMIFGNLSGGMEMFIVSGLVLVTGGVLLAMFNSDLMLSGLLAVFGRWKSLLPVFRMAISYPMNKKFRTALSLFIFSLIMFTVVVIAMIASFQRESVDTIAHKYSGGFEIIGLSMRDISGENITAGMAVVNAALGESAVKDIETATTAPIDLMKIGDNESNPSTLIGFSDSMLSAGAFSLQKRAEGYANDADVWKAISSDPTLAVMDGSVVPQMYGPQYGAFFLDVGDQISVEFQNGNSTQITVVGIMDQIFLQGVFTSATFVVSGAVQVDTNTFYVATSHSSSLTDADVAKQLEKQFVEYGFMTFVIKDTVEEFMSTVSSIMQLMEVFLGIGLVVGIAGLGIITIRNVTERRQEIGVMRAIGFQRRMILEVFLLETSFVSLLGIVLGVLLGLVLSWRMYDWGGFSENSPFIIPWGEILLLVTIAFAITLVSTLPPSRKASRLAPAEALRKID